MKPISLKEINDKFDKIDIFIASASFEDRCFSVIEAIDKNKIAKGFIFFNKNEELILAENVEKLKLFYNSYEIIELDSSQAIITSNAINLFFNELDGMYKSIVIDTTTFTHEGLLILIKFLQLHKDKFENIYLVYVGAEEYSTDEEEIENKWLSKGIKSIRSVVGYPGILKPFRKNHLIILFGFEIERTRKLIESFEFDIVSLGFGPANDSIGENHYKINYERHLELLSVYPSADKFEFSLTDPYQAASQIAEQANKFADHNIVIAPLNNKISTVGAALTAFKMPEIQLCYVAANLYNLKGYSKASESAFLIDFKI